MRRPRLDPSRHALPSLTLMTAGVIAAAGLVHLRFGPEHMGEGTVLGLAFYAMGVAQVATAAALVLRQRSARTARAAVVLNLSLAALWVVSRTVGLPFGHHAWEPEAAGAADVLCTVAEVWSALAVMVVLPRFRALPKVAAAVA